MQIGDFSAGVYQTARSQISTRNQCELVCFNTDLDISHAQEKCIYILDATKVFTIVYVVTSQRERILDYSVCFVLYMSKCRI